MNFIEGWQADVTGGWYGRYLLKFYRDREPPAFCYWPCRRIACKGLINMFIMLII